MGRDELLVEREEPSEKEKRKWIDLGCVSFGYKIYLNVGTKTVCLQKEESEGMSFSKEQEWEVT